MCLNAQKITGVKIMLRIIIHLLVLILLGAEIFHIVRFIQINDINLIQIQVIDFEWVNALYISIGAITTSFICFIFFIAVNTLNKYWYYVVYPVISLVLAFVVYYKIPFVGIS